MTKCNSCTFTLRVPNPLREKIDKFAEEKGIKPAEVVRRLLDREFERIEKENKQ